MASKFPSEGDKKVELHTRKCHDMTWSCDIHGEPIAFYCKEHGLPVCDRCAIKDHQKPCHLHNIGDVILELVGKLNDKQHEIEESETHLHNLNSKIQTCSADAINHLESIDGAINATFECKTKIQIQIQKINEKREKRIKSCNEEAEQQQLIIKKCKAKVLLETKEISEGVSKKIKDIKSKHQHAISTMNNIDARITRIKQEDKTLVNEAPQVLASLDEHLSLNIHQDVSDCLDRIQCGVQKVQFVKGEVGGEHYGRIDGCIGKWEVVKSIHIPSIVNKPELRGLISDDEICVWDVRCKDMYITNIRTELTEKVIEGDDSKVSITSCAPIDSNVIVCGKRPSPLTTDCTGESLDGFITLYDRQWKVIRDIRLPRNNSSDYTDVFVDVDKGGMILAAPGNQSNIYVINPADGTTVSTITMQGKEVWGGIQALSSGYIVLETGWGTFTVISRSGEEKDIFYPFEWFAPPECRVDKLTDTLYITYWDEERTIFVVDQVSYDDIFQARRIVEYEESDQCSVTNPCLITPSGKLVACNGDKVCVYKKKFIV